MKIGYARVSTPDQKLDLQINALKAAGCARIFEDHGISGSDRDRPALSEALNSLQAEDQLVVWKLDRLGRSLSHLIEILEGLSDRGVHFESLTERVDTKSVYGEFTFHMIGALAQMERRLISERTKEGMDAARRKGKRLGRPYALSDEQITEARRRIEIEGQPISRVAGQFSVSHKTLVAAIGRGNKAAA